MKYVKQCSFISIAAAVLLSGCNKAEIKTDVAVTETGVEIHSDMAAAEMKIETNAETQEENLGVPSFPSSYTGGNEKVRFDCTLEIPEGFDPSSFYLPDVTGLQLVDQDAAFQVGVGEQEIKEQTVEPKSADYIADTYYYYLTDGTMVCVDTGFYSGNDAASCYIRTEPANERGASKETFSFGTAEDFIEQIKNKLSAMSYPVEELQFSWFSLNKSEYQKLEQSYLADGSIEPDRAKGDWTEEDNVYEIYAWQMYGGLPVFEQMMTTRVGRAFESYKKAPLQAICSEKGILFLNANAPYRFEPTQEKAAFLEFPEIVSVIEEKYDRTLDDNVYTIYRAKLALRIYLEENQTYAAEPIWYFEVEDDNGGVSLILINALTGKEIYLDP